MKRRNATRSALFTSIISLLLCVSMLVGTTFAWFTDSVTSGVNTIASGNLDVELYYADKADSTSWTAVDNTTDVFGYDKWEPGYTKVVYFKVVNAGSLALKYKLSADVYSEDEGTSKAGKTFKLSDYLYTAVVEADATRDEILAMEGTKLNQDFAMDSASSLAASSEKIVGLAIWMPTTVGNEANHNGDQPTITFGINLVATQVESESDSFGKDYDVTAGLPGISFVPAPKDDQTGAFGEVRDEEDNKVGSYDIPKNAVDPNAEQLKVEIKKTVETPNFTVAANKEVQPFEIKVTGLKEGNTEPVKVTLNIEAGKDPDTVKLYHKDQLIPSSYNPTTGVVTFESASFSPFFVVYDADSVYTPPQEDESKLPVAKVVASPEYVNTELPWGSYGQWAPTEGLDSYLEAAYTFTCAETEDEAAKNPYAYWYCDFVVKLDKDLGENELFLGGNYGSFGWVGFHNGDLKLEANTEVPLLGSVTSNPWTYVDVATYVGKFICGVGDVNDALAGATFTVELRLTNPEDETDVIVIEKIEHVFTAPTVVETAEELATALAAGGAVKLGANIDMAATTLTVAKNVVLDLNGYVLSGTCNTSQGHLIMVNNGATLDIKDNSSAKTGKITYAEGSSNTGWAIDLEGKLNLHSGTIELTGESWDIAYCVDVRPNAWGSNYAESTEFTMHGGKLISSFDGIRVASSSHDGYANIASGFVMNGGVVDAARDGIFMQQSNEAYDTLSVIINDGTVKGTRPIRVYGPNAASVNEGTAKPMTITAKNDSLVLVGDLDTAYDWHTEGKIAFRGGMTLDNLNQYAAITLN